MRQISEIKEYMDEAIDKVWLMRTHPCNNPAIEKKRAENVLRILNTYNDISKDGYTNWESGYWCGILAALHWVLEDEKNNLDT